MSETKQISYRIPAELYEKLQSKTEEGGGKINEFCRDVLLSWVERNEDFSELLLEAYPEKKILMLLSELKTESAGITDAVVCKSVKDKVPNLRLAMVNHFEEIERQLDFMKESHTQKLTSLDSQTDMTEKLTRRIESKLKEMEAKISSVMNDSTRNSSLLEQVGAEVKKDEFFIGLKKLFVGSCIGFVIGCLATFMFGCFFRNETTISKTEFSEHVDTAIQKSVDDIVRRWSLANQEQEKRRGQKR